MNRHPARRSRLFAAAASVAATVAIAGHLDIAGTSTGKAAATTTTAKTTTTKTTASGGS